MQMFMIPKSIDRLALGKAVFEYTAESLERAQIQIKELGSKLSIIHIRHNDLMADVTGTCKKILEALNMTADFDYTERLENSIYFRQRHDFSLDFQNSLAKFGISVDAVEEQFAAYINEYCVSLPEVKEDIRAASDDVALTVAGESDIVATARDVLNKETIAEADDDIPPDRSQVISSTLQSARYSMESYALLLIVILNFSYIFIEKYFKVCVTSEMSIVNVVIAGIALIIYDQKKENLASRGDNNSPETIRSAIISSSNVSVIKVVTRPNFPGPSDLNSNLFPTSTNDWISEFVGEWIISDMVGANEWFSDVQGFNFVVRKVAVATIAKLQVKLLISEDTVTIERSLGAAKHWKASIALGRSEVVATPLSSSADGDEFTVKAWTDETNKTLHMFFEPNDRAGGFSVRHIRRILSPDVMEMVFI